MKSLLECNEVESMSKDTSMAFMSCTMAEMKDEPAPEEIKEQFSYKVMRKRLDLGGIPVSDWTLAFLSCLCDNPAKLVMYAHACVEIYRKRRKEVTLHELSLEFSMGFPTDAALQEHWDAQKGFNNGLKDVDNILDTRGVWQP